MQIEIWYCTFFLKACDIFCSIKHKKPQKTPSKKKSVNRTKISTHISLCNIQFVGPLMDHWIYGEKKFTN